MPSLPKKNRPTYAVKARSTFIEDKARAFKGMDRSNDTFYNSRQWRKLRLMILQRDPVCKECEKYGRVESSTVCDHIVPLLKGGPKLNPSNLQGLCTRCHNSKSARDK